jgi:uncharacterized protein with FMN-binding domain
MTARRNKIIITTVAGFSAAMAGCTTPATDVATSPSTPSGVTASRSPSSEDSTNSDSTYRDGDYAATGEYGSLPSSIGVAVTLVDDVITTVSVAPQATNPSSRDFQNRFADAIPALVVGRNIDEVNVSRVAGSSGTPDGFNAAIERIKAQASN